LLPLPEGEGWGEGEAFNEMKISYLILLSFYQKFDYSKIE